MFLRFFMIDVCSANWHTGQRKMLFLFSSRNSWLKMIDFIDTDEMLENKKGQSFKKVCFSWYTFFSEWQQQQISPNLPINLAGLGAWGYDHNFLRFVYIFCRKNGTFHKKTMLWSKFCKKT
jgi:hypothetical protein